MSATEYTLLKSILVTGGTDKWISGKRDINAARKLVKEGILTIRLSPTHSDIWIISLILGISFKQ